MAIGADAIRSEMMKRPVFAIVIARDASGNARGRLGQILDEVPTVVVGTKEELGRALGRRVAALAGVLDRDLGRRVVELASGTESAGDDVDGAGTKQLG